MTEPSNLRPILEKHLSCHFLSECRIREMERTPHPRRSSFQLERLAIRLDDGRRLNLIFKNVGPDGLLPSADQERVGYPYDPLCEIRTYRELLTPSRDVPLCYGCTVDVEAACYWLFLENVEGMELVDIGNLSIWKEALIWLSRFQRCADSSARFRNFFEYGPEYYHLWVERASHAIPRLRDRWDLPGDLFEKVSDRYHRVVRHLMTLPRTIVHGEFYPSNIIVAEKPDGGLRICPLDWGTTAIGPRMLDVASLTAGCWSEAQRFELAEAYRCEALPNMKQDEFERSLAFCRLHLSMQWLASCDRRPSLPPLTGRWVREAILLQRKILDYI